jgi:hypothetical protein
MSLPILATLGRAARAAFPIIERGVNDGLSATAINNVIRDGMGQGIRRQTLLEIMRAVKGVEQTSSQLRFLAPDSMPNPSRLSVAITTIRRRYAFTVEIRGALVADGSPIKRNVTVSTDRLLTRSQIEDLAQSMVEDDSKGYGIDIDSAVIIKGVRAGESGVLS